MESEHSLSVDFDRFETAEELIKQKLKTLRGFLSYLTNRAEAWLKKLLPQFVEKGRGILLNVFKVTHISRPCFSTVLQKERENRLN